MTFALFLLYVALSFMHPGELFPALAPYRIVYWVGLAALAVAFASLLNRRDGPLATIQLWIMLLFAGVMGLSLMVAERWFGAPILTIQRFGPSLTIFILAICGTTSLVRLRAAADCVVVLITAVMLQGAAAYHFGLNSRQFLLDRASRTEDAALVAVDEPAESGPFELVDDNDNDEESESEQVRIRGLGLMHDPNDLAVGMIVALGLIGGAWKARPQLRDVLLAAAAAALIYGIYLTRSRGGAVALVIVIWRFAADRIGRVAALVLLVALGAGVLALDFGGRSLSLEDESASERVVAWTEGLEMLKAQPLLGVGFGQFLDHHTLTAHNSLVLCFAETGLVGCFLWVGLIVVTLLELQALKRLPGDEAFDEMARQLADGLQLSLLGFLTAAFFLSRTFVPTLYLIVGLSAALAAIARQADRSIAVPPLPALGTIALACELAGIAVVYAIVKLHVA